VNFTVYTGRLSGYMEGECLRRSRGRNIGIYDNKRVFLVDLKKEFGGGDDETIKVAELKKVEQESRAMEVFMQKFRRAAKRSRYKDRLLIEEFKQKRNE